MPYRKEEFTNDGIYHIVLRGIDDNLIFKDVNDYYRGIFSIYEFNNLNPVTIQEKRRIRNSLKKAHGRRTSRELGRRAFIESAEYIDSRDRLVDVLTFCFMPNHIHLLLRQVKENGIHKFMVKLGSGYGRYFNQKYLRKGYVFQNRFRSVAVNNNDYLLIVTNYIHANPISIIEPGFKEFGIRSHSVEEVVDFLKNKYRWSGFLDYVGFNNFPSVTERGFLLEAIGGKDNMMNNILDWIAHKREAALYREI